MIQKKYGLQISVATEVIAKVGISGKEIAAIGITNQRETTIIWDRETSEPVYNAIVWQDRRTAKYCDVKSTRACRYDQEEDRSSPRCLFGTKVKWILDNVPGARKSRSRETLF
jgi:glycerol kinase